MIVTELMGSSINYSNGDYSRGASGFWVENGEVKFPVSEITIAGNLNEMFKNLIAVMIWNLILELMLLHA